MLCWFQVYCNVFVYIYVFFFRFFSVIYYYKIMNIVPVLYDRYLLFIYYVYRYWVPVLFMCFWIPFANILFISSIFINICK